MNVRGTLFAVATLSIRLAVAPDLTAQSLYREPDNPETPQAKILVEARALRLRNDFRGALPLFERSVALCEEAHDDRTLVAALTGLGTAAWGVGDYARSVSVKQRALSIVRSAGFDPIEAVILHDIGNALYSWGRYDQALDYLRQAREADARAPDVRVEGSIHSTTGLVYRYLGRLDDSRAELEQALALRRQAGDDLGAGQTLNALGIVSRATGQFDRALDFYQQSLAVRRKIGDRQGEAQALSNMANVLTDLGEFEAAIENNLKALEISEAIDYRVQIGFSNANIASILEDQGRLAEALPRYEAALAVYRALDRRQQIADALRNVGRLRLELGNLSGAHVALDEGLAIAREVKEPETEALTLETLGNLALAEKDPQTAAARQTEALAISRRIGAPSVEWEVLGDRGHAFQALNRSGEAIADYRLAASIVNDLRANIRSEAGRVGLLDNRRRAFFWLADALVAAGRSDEALEIAEASRARAFADLLAQRDVGLKPAQRASVDRVRTEIDRLSTSSNGPSAGLDATATRSGSLEAALAGLKSTSQELASLLTADSPSLAEIRSLAGRLHSTLVEYMVTPERLFAWVVATDGTIHSVVRDTAASRLDGLAQQIRTANDAAARGATSPPPVDEPLHALYELLIAPIAEWLPANPDDPVVVIPDGPLAYVPFAALLDDRREPLIARHVLASAPSAGVYRYTSQKTTTRSSEALVVADPTPPAGSRLSSLPWSRVEAKQVGARLGNSHVRLLQGADAKEAAIKRLSPDYGILHFATHGLISPSRPLASSLALAEGEGDDGYLRVSEVFGMDLHARLVVLSGCSTGLGRLTSEGPLGLTRAFIFAGTPTVIVSQWDVSDRPTSVLMDRFYEALKGGRSIAAALRTAALATRKQFPHPSFWAAFEVVGQPQ